MFRSIPRFWLPFFPNSIAAGRRSTFPSRLLLGRRATQELHRRKNHNHATAVNIGDKNDGKHIKTCSRVLIVGGGPSGLFLAHLLRSYDVPFCLIEAQTPEQRFKHPQAHFLNTRTMEILKHGLSYCNINNNDNDNNNSPYSKAENTNDVYQKLRAAMPPVEEWKSFRFGPDMIGINSNGEDNLMAEVIHPVERPLMAEEDANGQLLMGPRRQKGFKNDSVKTDNNNDLSLPTNDHDGIPLSSESVGHLAQHTFCRILYDALVETTQTTITTPNKMLNNIQNNKDKQHDGNIIYGQRATEFDWNGNIGRWTVKTDQGEIFEDIESIVAADGATSTIRRNLFSDIIPPILSSDNDTSNDPTMIGTPNLQRLMNVHFTVSGDATVERIDKEDTEEQIKIPPAMLYTVFHPDVLAMVVRHGPGDYVLQIPYFKPYQTPEEDFTIDKVHKMVQSALGGRDNFIIKSIRPWTMGSLVARKYYSDNGVFLVGDAAHVFPPAGGFGMNTGLQDVYSLAWRLASYRHHQEQQKEEPNDDKAIDSSVYDPSFPSSLSTVGRMYERERQPVARRNAALSVRNYRRVLNVMRSCYLDDRHPALLIQALDATASFVPLELRRNTFRALLRTALSPLSQLQTSPNGVYARTIKANLRSLLGSGQGLPLLFPKHELDFSYRYESNKDEGEKINAEEDWSKDSVASSPRLAVGALFPHVVASVSPETFRQFPRLLPIDDDRLFVTTTEPPRKVSTRDLALQLATEKTPCSFCLLEIVAEKTVSMDTRSQVDDDSLISLQHTLEKSIGLPFSSPCRVIVSANENNTTLLNEIIYQEPTRNNRTICTMYVDNPQWESLNLLPEKVINKQRIFVVIRPDGHVAAISDDANLDDLILGTRSILV
jgi:2-polyprenyl-6-methoxyphenol hydroxylase-like FAD-dependent oxidoreductase